MANLKNKNDLKCRLCLVDSDSKMQDLFSKQEYDNRTGATMGTDEFSKLALYEKVEYCCGLKLTPKPQLPTKICVKCINIINMWSNFRQMVCNSQAFLASQIQLSLEEEMVASNIKNLERMRTEILRKTEEQQQGKQHDLTMAANSIDSHIEVDYLVEEVDDDMDDNGNHDFSAGDDSNDKDYEPPPADLKRFDLSKLYQTDLAEVLSAEDFSEAFDYLNADNDDELERIIEHCATKNVALQTLRRKAVASNIKERAAAKKPPSAKKKSAPKQDDSPNKLTKPSMFMCNICGNVYSKKPLFQYHMRMHSDVKPYQCEICSKSYRIMSDLRNHMYRHTGERPFKCKFCDRHFMDRSSRHRHERVHTNSRPYTCNVCNKSFTYSAILKNHMKLHTGEKDYICAVCNKSFTLAHQLKAHMLTLTHRQKEAAFEAQGYKVIFEAVEMTKTTKN